jgi:hypothetical protein
MNASVASTYARGPARPEIEGVFGLLLLGILLVTTVDEAALAQIGRGLMLACFAVLVVVNAGAAAGVYIGTAAVFSVHHFGGQGSWVERPDNYALLMLSGYLAMARSFSRGSGALDRTFVAILLLIAVTLLSLVAMGQLSAHEFSWFIRMFGAPLTLFILLRRAQLAPREVRAMFLVLAGMGTYLALVSVFEAFRWYDLIIPSWITDPEVNGFFEAGRVVGLLMQPEWNAMTLSLALCVLLLRLDAQRWGSRFFWVGAGIVGLLAVYFTYTRAAWLGLILAGVPAFWSASARRGVTVRRRAAFLACVLMFAAVTLLFPSDITRERMADTGTVVYRVQIWAAGIGMVADHPLLGVGFGQFIKHVGDYEQLTGIPQVTDPAGLADLAHNTTLSVAAELGLIGLTF